LHDIRYGTSVMQELFGVCCGQFLREDLQAVAIRVEEVNALGEHVISGELYMAP